jgi:hypothetical protein
MRRAWGEQLSEAERAELAAARAEDLGKGLEAAEAELRAAYTAARPAAGLAAKVLAALPAAPQVARGAAGADSLKVFVAPEVRYAGWRRIGLAVGLAAAVAAAAVGAYFAYTAAAPPNVSWCAMRAHSSSGCKTRPGPGCEGRVAIQAVEQPEGGHWSTWRKTAEKVRRQVCRPELVAHHT